MYQYYANLLIKLTRDNIADVFSYAAAPALNQLHRSLTHPGIGAELGEKEPPLQTLLALRLVVGSGLSSDI